MQAFGSLWFDNTANAEPGPGRATFSLLLLGAGICPLRWREARVSAYACANGQLGMIKSRGNGFDQPRADGQKFVLAGAIEGRLSVRIAGPIAIRGGASAVVPLVRDRFAFRRADGSSLPDSLLVRTYRGADGALGALHRVSCPSLEVTQIAKGDSVINLSNFAREDDGNLLAIDRYNGSRGVIRYRLMRSADQGKTWNALTVPEGWQSSTFAARGKRLVVAPPKIAAVLVSTDRGEHWTTEPIDAHTSVAGFDTTAVHIADSGVVTIGATCNYLIHRRTPVP